MAADMHIHVLPNEVNSDFFKRFNSNCLGSKWFGWVSNKEYSKHFGEDSDLIWDCPNVWVGEVSWLKDAFFEDDSYIPNTVEAIFDIIGEDLPILDDVMIEKIRDAFNLPNRSIKNGGVYEGKGYALADVDKVVAFLNQHKGKRVFTVSW